MRQKYGCKPNPPDQRDHKLLFGAVPLPEFVDLRPLCSRVENQEQLSSCVANATVGAMEILERKSGMEQRDLSRLFVYYNTRVLDGNPNADEGSFIRNAMRAVQSLGTCIESAWPYDEGSVLKRPTEDAYTDAIKRRSAGYALAGQGIGVRTALAKGLPVVFGMILKASFDNVGRNGIVPVPSFGEANAGCHAMLIVGYKDNRYIVRNSWGEGWGDNGYCYIPFQVVDDPSQAFDFTSVLSVTDGGEYEVFRPDPDRRTKEIDELNKWT